VAIEFRDDQHTVVEVEPLRAPSGPRLRVRDVNSHAEICLDPIELEGLARIGGAGEESNGGEARTAELPADAALELLQNEFAMVEVGRVDGPGGGYLLVRDLGSRTEAFLEPAALRSLTRLRHRSFAAMLDPSRLVQAAEPDPDQV
jgi:hypothetical protein